MREYRSLRSRLVDLFTRETKTAGVFRSIVTVAAAARALPYSRLHHELFSLPFYRSYLDAPDDVNPMFHLRHRHYLCAGWGIRERVAAALSHYRFEEDQHSGAYQDAVYQAGGLSLWSNTCNGTEYTLRLRGTSKDRHEGGTSIVLMTGNTLLSEMSYAWVDPTLIQAGPGNKLIFITRNQSIRPDAAELKQFRKDFPQHSPPYFCLAALQGIALVHRQTTLAGIKHDRQIAYVPRFANSFRRSYCEFWQSFAAIDVSPLAYLMHLPLMVRPLDRVASKHRTRAAERRTQWASITKSAMESINCHVHSPINVEAESEVLRSTRAGSDVPVVS